MKAPAISLTDKARILNTLAPTEVLNMFADRLAPLKPGSNAWRDVRAAVKPMANMQCWFGNVCRELLFLQPRGEGHGR